MPGPNIPGSSGDPSCPRRPPTWCWSAKQRRLLAEAEGSARAEEVEDLSMGPMDTLKFVGAIGVYVAFFYAVAASLTGLTGAA